MGRLVRHVGAGREDSIVRVLLGGEGEREVQQILRDRLVAPQQQRGEGPSVSLVLLAEERVGDAASSSSATSSDAMHVVLNGQGKGVVDDVAAE
eukprot:188996-Hanusia_phi.AAC.1